MMKKKKNIYLEEQINLIKNKDLSPSNLQDELIKISEEKNNELKIDVDKYQIKVSELGKEIKELKIELEDRDLLISKVNNFEKTIPLHQQEILTKSEKIKQITKEYDALKQQNENLLIELQNQKKLTIPEKEPDINEEQNLVEVSKLKRENDTKVKEITTLKQELKDEKMKMLAGSGIILPVLSFFVFKYFKK